MTTQSGPLAILNFVPKLLAMRGLRRMGVMADRNGHFDRLRPGFRPEPGIICHMIALKSLPRHLLVQ